MPAAESKLPVTVTRDLRGTRRLTSGLRATYARLTYANSSGRHSTHRSFALPRHGLLILSSKKACGSLVNIGASKFDDVYMKSVAASRSVAVC